MYCHSLPGSVLELEKNFEVEHKIEEAETAEPTPTPPSR